MRGIINVKFASAKTFFGLEILFHLSKSIVNNRELRSIARVNALF